MVRWGTDRRRRTVGAVHVLALVAVVAAGCGVAGGLPGPAEPLTVGILRSVPDPDHAVFVDELRVQGWVLGRDVTIVPVDPDELISDLDRARAELDRWLPRGLDLVVAFSTPLAQLAKQHTPQVPGLFLVNDPVASGLVDTPEEPEGLLTGLTFRVPADRTLDVALRTFGDLRRVGYLEPADDPAVPGHRTAVLDAAEELGIEVAEAAFTDPTDVDAAVRDLAAADVDAVFLATSTATVSALPEIEDALAAHRLPGIANTDFAEFAVVILTPDRAEMRRQLARQTARLLAGAPVASVPVEDPRRFLLIVNQTQARALGIGPLDDGLLRQATLVR